MNAFERGFYSEMEKTASAARPAYSAAKGALLGGLLGAGGLAAFSHLGHHEIDSNVADAIAKLRHELQQRIDAKISSSMLPKEWAEKYYNSPLADLYREGGEALIRNAAVDEHSQLAGQVDKAAPPVLAGSSGGLGLLAGLRRAIKDSRENKAAPSDVKASMVDKIKSMLAKKK